MGEVQLCTNTCNLVSACSVPAREPGGFQAPQQSAESELMRSVEPGEKFTESQNGRGWKGPLWVI